MSVYDKSTQTIIRLIGFLDFVGKSAKNNRTLCNLHTWLFNNIKNPHRGRYVFEELKNITLYVIYPCIILGIFYKSIFIIYFNI